MKRLWYTIWPTLAAIAWMGVLSVSTHKRGFVGVLVGLWATLVAFAAIRVTIEHIIPAYRARWNNYRP